MPLYSDSDVNVLDDLLHMETDTDFDQETDDHRMSKYLSESCNPFSFVFLYIHI